MRVKDKVAVVTGVANPNGIGYASAKALVREGAILALVDASKHVHERADELKTAGYNVISFQLDLTDLEKVKNMAQKVIAKYGKVDILANVAGLSGVFGASRRPRTKGFEEIAEKDHDYLINVNLKTTFNCIKTFLPGMLERKYGKIVNVSSVTGPQVCGPSASGYTAGKAGVCGLTKTLALEVAAYGITVNSILPGWIYTGGASYGEPGTPRRMAYDKSIPVKRLGRPEDCADLVLFLASDESSYVNGAEFIIDGANVIQEMKMEPAYPTEI
ncbi:MAG: SDR family oxidoreductase [Candidatus Bathyarchaeota archaeon]|nr:MAG: SDR family oxidoreductase [Candidatus Bathyarchaeota archaeon]